MGNLESIELEIATAKNMIKLKDTLALLRENKYFKEVIEQDYFTYEMNRLVMLKGVPHIDGLTEENIDKMIFGISALNHYFNEINRRGTEAVADLTNREETRQEILAEEIA